MSDNARRTSASSSSDLIGTLVADLAPVRPVRLARTIAVAMLLEIAVVSVVSRLLGVHMVGMERLADPAFAGLVLTLTGGAAASAAAMATLSIPGRTVGAGWRAFVLALPLVIAALVVSFSPWGGTWKGFLAVFTEGFGCTRDTLYVATPAWIAGLLYLRRLGPLDPVRVGLFSSFAALLSAALMVQMGCPNCDSWHMAISHYVPILLAAWAGAMVSPVVLRGRWGG